MLVEGVPQGSVVGSPLFLCSKWVLLTERAKRAMAPF